MNGRACMLSVLALCIAGCGSGGNITQTPTAISPPFEFGDKPRRLWSAKMDAWAADVDLVLVADDHHLYAPGRSSLAAFALANGKLRWTSEVGEISGGLQTSEESLLASLFDGHVVAVAKTDGASRWTAFTTGEVLAPVARTKRLAFALTNNGRLTALDLANGKTQWVVENSTPALSLRGTSSPIALRGRVFYVDDHCKARMLNSNDGSPIWERTLAIPEGSNEIEQLVDADSQPMLLGKDLFVSCYNSNLMQVSAENGQAGWQVPASSRHDMLFSEAQLIFVEESDSSVLAFNAVNGQQQWKRTELAYRQLSNPVQWRGFILIGDHEGYIHMLRGTDGLIVGRFRPFRSKVRSMLADGDRLYAIDAKGNIRAFQPPKS